MASIWMHLEGEPSRISEWIQNKGQSKEFVPCRWSHHPLRQRRCGSVQGLACGDWEQNFRRSIVNSHQASLVAQLAKNPPAMQEIPV